MNINVNQSDTMDTDKKKSELIDFVDSESKNWLPEYGAW